MKTSPVVIIKFIRHSVYLPVSIAEAADVSPGLAALAVLLTAASLLFCAYSC